MEKVDVAGIERLDAGGQKLKVVLQPRGSKPLLPGVTINSVWIILDKQFAWTCQESFLAGRGADGSLRLMI